MKRILFKHPGSKFVGWPDDFTAQFNGSKEPCDMLVGFCSCGASHYETEERIVAILNLHNAEVRDYPENPSREVMLEVLGPLAIQALDEDYAEESESMTLSYF